MMALYKFAALSAMDCIELTRSPPKIKKLRDGQCLQLNQPPAAKVDHVELPT
jgi:hypothetical protein